jgi:hypothetical protein
MLASFQPVEIGATGSPDSPICRFNTEVGSVPIPLADLSSSARK